MTDLDTQHRLNAAVHALNAGDLGQAEALAQEMLDRSRKDPEAIAILGHVAMKRQQYDDAIARFRECVKNHPKVALGHVYLGEALARHGRFREALDRFDKALKLEPGQPRALVGKADVHLVRGHEAKARRVLEGEVAAGRGGPEAAACLAEALLQAGEPADAIATGAPYFDAEGIPPGIRYRLGSVLGKAHERLGGYGDAFHAYARGNASANAPFDPAAREAITNGIIDAFSADALGRLPRSTVADESPVFIIGMPRSGSTLVERILDAHPLVHGAGELGLIFHQLSSLALDIGSSQPYPACVADFDQSDVDRGGAAYIEGLRRVGGKAERVVDKNLGNYLHLGYIALITPRARIIHCRRDPLDTCLSCYAEALPPAVHPYTTNLTHLGFVYRLYTRLMEHWRHILEIDLLEIDYETLVADQERESRRLIDFCGLDWDERCLRPHESKYVARTLSHAQTRQPMYTSSVARSERFAEHLGPLREALAGERAAT